MGGLVFQDAVNSVDLTSAGADAGAAAGTYDIVPSNAAVTTGLPENYNLIYVNGTLSVEAAPVPPPTEILPYMQDQLRYKIPYIESLTPHQINPLDLLSSTDLIGPVYFYQPLTETDSSAFAQFEVKADDYQFLNGQLNLNNHDGLLPMFEQLEQKKKKTL